MFAPGQTARTVDVPVVHDARPESAETLTLRLSGATGARLADTEATGTIVNAGPGPREWQALYGRTDVWHVASAPATTPCTCRCSKPPRTGKRAGLSPLDAPGQEVFH